MKVMNAVKKGFEIAGKNLNIVMVVFGFSLIGYIVSLPFTPPVSPAGGFDVVITPQLFFFRVVFFILSVFIYAGIFNLLRDAIKTGKAELNKFVAYGKKFYLKLLGLLALLILIIWIAAFIAVFIGALSGLTNNAVIIFITAIVALSVGALGVYLELLLLFSPYILVVEEVSIVESMKKSIGFVRTNILKVIGLGGLLVLAWLGAFLGIFLITLVPQLIFNMSDNALGIVVGVLFVSAASYLSVAVAATLMNYYLSLKSPKASA